MAKVNGALFSLGARGKFAKTMVYMSWKGIDDVRQYVIPANPKTAAQTTQRGHLAYAVEEYKSLPFNTIDKQALSIWASTEARPMSGFNKFIKEEIDMLIKGWTPNPAYKFAVTSNSGGSISFDVELKTAMNCKVKYGTGLAYMTETESLSVKSGQTKVYEGTLSGLTPGSAVYIQVVTQSGDNEIVSGIYKVIVA
jgi:hypothetical protein